MFRKWLRENKASDFDFSGAIYKKATDREYWNTQYKKEYIENAEKYLGYEWPLIRATDYIAFNTEGNRKKQESPHFAKRAALIALTFGEALEYKGRFIPDIVDGIYSICEESFWGVSAHYCVERHPKLPFYDHYIDLFAAETGALISVVLYLLGDKLYEFWPEVVERAEYNIEKRIADPYLNHRDFWWMAYDRDNVNNWNPWILSNLLTVFLLTQQKNERFFEAIEKMLFELNVFYKSYSDDGGCEEGMTYWFLSGLRILDFCNQICLATNGEIDFLNDEKLIKMGEYPYKAYIGNNYRVNFADGGCKGTVGHNAQLYNCGILINNKNLQAIAKEYEGKPSSLHITHIKNAISLFEFFKESTSACDLKLPENECFPILQNAFAREGKWYYAAKGGHNREHHNHNDVGNFIVYHNLKPLLIDVGVGVYTKNTFLATERYKIWTMRSDWHNLPTINNKVQQFGREFLADRFEYDNKKCKISFKGAYEEDTDLKSLTREIDISADGIDISDEFIFSKSNNTVCEHFVTPMTVEIKDKTAIIGKKFILSTNADAEIMIEKQDFCGDENLTHSWDTDCVYRITFKLNAKDELNVKFTLREI